MGGRIIALVALCASTGCFNFAGLDEPDLEVGPGEVALIDYSHNGSIGCDGGTVIVEASGSVNGSIEAVDCKLTLFRANNGDVTVTGGALLHIRDAYTINGALDAVGVKEVRIINTGFNGDAYIAGSATVTVINSSMNGDLVIENARRCDQYDNRARSIVTSESCIGPL